LPAGGYTGGTLDGQASGNQVDPRQREQLQAAMTALAGGDRSAFHPVFAGLWPVLLRFCQHSLRDLDLAQDAAQAALMKLFLHATEFRADRDAVAWALGFAAFECRTTRNRGVRRREENDETRLLAIAGGGPSPEDASVEADLHSAAMEVLGSLRPGDAETLQLALAGDRPAGSPAFRKRLQRALERLRTAWRQTHGSHD
jgi:RNA polymerase sigma-70 factor, ECF subfamily